MQVSAEVENAGVAFVSFKNKDSVIDTIEEIDLVKSKLVGKDHYDALEIKNWDVELAPPSGDIIWTELNQVKTKSLFVRFLMKLFPFIICVIFIQILIFIDCEMRKGPEII